jgi:nicotinamide mononucleotide transporter
MDPLEVLAASLSLVAVALTVVRNAICWPVGIASVLLYAWIFFGAHLFSDAMLQGVYAILLGYGWWNWRRAPRDATEHIPRIASSGRGTIALGFAAGLAGWAILGWSMSTFTSADYAWLDSGLAAFSLVAEFWTARLLRINWLLWILVDVIYVGLYMAKGLPVTAGLYAVFIALAAWGWREWGKRAGRRKIPAN